MIPTDEQVERGARAMHAFKFDSEESWESEAEMYRKMFRDAARACLTAALGDSVPALKAEMANEAWAIVRDWADYEISNLGRLRSLDRTRPHNAAPTISIPGKLLKSSLNHQGYVVATLRNSGVRKIVRVHRLVAEAFVPNPDSKMCVNHIDCVRSNNCWLNLEWCTQLENIQHSDRLGRMQKNFWVGRRSPSAMLSDEQVRLIRLLYATGRYSLESLGKEFEISKRAIGRAIHRETYADVGWPSHPLATYPSTPTARRIPGG